MENAGKCWKRLTLCVAERRQEGGYGGEGRQGGGHGNEGKKTFHSLHSQPSHTNQRSPNPQKEEKHTTPDQATHSAEETSTKSVVKEVEKPKATTEADKEDKKKSDTVAAMSDTVEVEVTHMEAVEDMEPMMMI